jgi:hypothetical protein
MRWLIEQVVDTLTQRRQFELWEAPADGQSYFMVAGRLTRQEAVSTAIRHTTTWPRLRALVLDGQGKPVDC